VCSCRGWDLKAILRISCTADIQAGRYISHFLYSLAIQIICPPQPRCVFQWPPRPLFASSASATTTSPTLPLYRILYVRTYYVYIVLRSRSVPVGLVILSSCSSLLVSMLVSDILQIAYGWLGVCW